jgi:feruloyl-CoA hydratase/lyase
MNGMIFVTLKRPSQRKAMTPALDREMLDCILDPEADGDSRVLILTGAGEVWCAGMDLKLYFRELDSHPRERIRAGASAAGSLLPGRGVWTPR